MELTEGEFVNYTVHEVEKPCAVTLEGVGECEVEVFLNGESMGKVKLPAGNILRPHLSEKVVIPAGAEQTVKLVVQKGTLTLKTVKFAY